MLSYAEMLNLKRWNTPAVYNGWERVTRLERNESRFNREPVHDFMPQMGVMVGTAVTVICEPSNAAHQRNNPDAQRQYMQYLASVPGPKIVMVKDLDSPHIGSFWGEINANMHKVMGCVGTITEGCIRDVDEMTNAGFHALARRLCVGHAYSTPVQWGCEVEAFGTAVRPGDFIHADKHGFMAIDEEDCKYLLEATRFMDANECDHLLRISRDAAGMDLDEFIRVYSEGVLKFRSDADAFFSTINRRK